MMQAAAESQWRGVDELTMPGWRGGTALGEWEERLCVCLWLALVVYGVVALMLLNIEA